MVSGSRPARPLELEGLARDLEGLWRELRDFPTELGPGSMRELGKGTDGGTDKCTDALIDVRTVAWRYETESIFGHTPS